MVHGLTFNHHTIQYLLYQTSLPCHLDRKWPVDSCIWPRSTTQIFKNRLQTLKSQEMILLTSVTPTHSIKRRKKIMRKKKNPPRNKTKQKNKTTSTRRHDKPVWSSASFEQIRRSMSHGPVPKSSNGWVGPGTRHVFPGQHSSGCSCPGPLRHLPSSSQVIFASTWPASLRHIPCPAPGALFESVPPGWVATAEQEQVEAEFKSLMNRGPDWPLPGA